MDDEHEDLIGTIGERVDVSAVTAPVPPSMPFIGFAGSTTIVQPAGAVKSTKVVLVGTTSLKVTSRAVFGPPLWTVMV